MRAASRAISSVAAACLISAAGFGIGAGQTPGSTPSLSQDEQAIYAAVLTSWVASDTERQSVNQRLGPPPSASDPETADCVKGLRFPRTPDAPVAEKLLSSSTFGADAVVLVDGDTWSPSDPGPAIARGEPVNSAVDKAISRSLVSFSQITFSVDRKDALVRFSMACGRLCGTGFTLQMHKSLGVWTTGRRCGNYIS